MKTIGIRVYRKTLTYLRDSYACGRDNVISCDSSTIVVFDTDTPGQGVEPDYDSPGDPVAVYA